MPWRRSTLWLSGRRSPLLDDAMAFTLVTLSAIEPAEHDEVAFYRDAKYAALVEWAKMGRFILALAATERDELTLLCVETPAEMRMRVQELPMVAAGLARFDIRTVMSLRFDDVGGG